MFSTRERTLAIFLVALTVGYMVFLLSQPAERSTPRAAPTFTAEDHRLMLLVSRRDADGIRAELESGQIPIDYAVGGRMDIFTIATSTKLPDLLAFLLQQEDARVSSTARSFVFALDEEHRAESLAITRMYLEHTYEQDRMVLDADDSVGLLIIMCSLRPYTPDEIDVMLDGFAIHAPESIINDAVGAFENDPSEREGAGECFQQVLQHVTALPA
jgi:hypothetical protein